MTSLFNLSLEKVPLSSIVSTGFIDRYYLDSEAMEIIRSRITFEALYQNEILSPNLDLNIFLMALEKVAPQVIWDQLLGDQYDDSLEYPSVYSDLGLDILSDYGLGVSDIISVLDNFLTQIIAFVSSPGIMFLSDVDEMTWDFKNDRYRFISLNQDKEELYFSTLDDLLVEVIIPNLSLSIVSTTSLTEMQIRGLDLLARDHLEEINQIIKKLSEEKLYIETEMTIGFITSRYLEIEMVDQYLYIFGDDRIVYYFDPQDIPLVLAPLIYNYDQWSYKHL